MTRRKIEQRDLFDQEQERRICSSCKQSLPLSRFSKNPKRKGGLHNQCRDCRSRDWKATRAAIMEQAKRDGLCPVCRKTKLTEGESRCEPCRKRQRECVGKKKQERAVLGVCRGCGGSLPPEARVCESCGKRNRRAQQMWRIGQREKGLCVRCTNPAAEGFSLCARCREIDLTQGKARRDRAKDAAFEAYGGYRCACCGETEKEFLQLDHVAGGGAAHRRRISKGGKSGDMYGWLKKNNYPPGLLRVLCANCNWAVRDGRECPHERRRREQAGK